MIIAETEEDGCEMDTDMIRIVQLMKNLVNKPYKFTEKGHVKFGFRRMDDRKVLLFVEDTFIGLSK